MYSRRAVLLLAYSVGFNGNDPCQSTGARFYAKQNVKTPLRIALISPTATQAMNLTFIGWIEHAGLALLDSLPV